MVHGFFSTSYQHFPIGVSRMILSPGRILSMFAKGFEYVVRCPAMPALPFSHGSAVFS